MLPMTAQGQTETFRSPIPNVRICRGKRTSESLVGSANLCPSWNTVAQADFESAERDLPFGVPSTG